MTYRLFDEMTYLKRRLDACASEMVYLKERVEVVEQSLFSSLTEIDGLPVLVAHIIYQCGIEYNVTVERLRSGTEARGADLQAARNLAIFRISELGRFRAKEVAAWFQLPIPAIAAAKAKGKLIDASKRAKE